MNRRSNVADMRGVAADINGLPIRLDVVVADREFTLRELQDMPEGSIIEVHRTTHEPLQVKLNGRAAGDGELVEMNGRLGVRILRWRQA